MFNHIYDNPSQAALHYYLAGIVDGEGCIRIDRSVHAGKNSLYKAVLQVGMVERNVIELIHNTFGGSMREERVPNRRNIWRVKIQSVGDWSMVLPALDGKLLVKQPQLDLVKEFLNDKIHNPNHKRNLVPEELLRRERLYHLGREFNAVGAGATTERDGVREG